MSSVIKHTTCAYCGVGCGVKATVNQNERSIQVSGLDTHPSNYGRLCSKGSALADTISLEERLLDPEINGEKVEWETALNSVASNFKKIIDEHGPNAVAFYLSGQLLTEDYYAANKLMKGFIGGSNIDTNSRLCMSSSVTGHKRAFGSDTVPGCYEDFEQAELITLVGSNTAWCHPVLYQRIKAYKEINPNLKVVVIDPRRTQTCEIADLHLPIALGADTWLFNGLLQHLNNHHYLDQDFIDEHCEGFLDAIKTTELSAPDISQTAKACDVSKNDLLTFYSWFSETEQAVTLYSQGVNQSSAGTDKVNSIINCHLATGRIGKPGTGPFSMTGQPNAMGGREVGGLATTLASHMEFEEDNIQRLKRFWKSPTMATQPGLPAVDLFDAIHDGTIKAVWIAATNPLVSLPNADKAKAALEKCEFVVVSDCIADTDTNRVAHVKLPATGWSEKDGTVTNSERRISRQRGLLIPAGNARHDWWIFSRVAQAMGFNDGFNYTSPADIFREHAALSGYENIETSDPNKGRLRDFDISIHKSINEHDYNHLTPFQWPANAECPDGKKRVFADGQFFTKNRKAQFIAITPRQPENLPSSQYPFKLNSGRIRDQWHTMTRTGLAAQLNQHISEPFVEIHPSDATRRQLVNEQLVKIQSQWGEMIARVTVTDSIKAGDLFTPIHWTSVLSNNSRVGAVTNPAVDPICFQPESKHTPVQISVLPTQWHGFILNRQPIEWPECDYVVQVKGKQHTRLEIAGCSKLTNPITQLSTWLNISDSIDDSMDVLTYEDTQNGLYRLAVIDSESRLQAVAFISPNVDLPERTWLSMAFEKTTIDSRARAALLSGQAPAGEDIGAIVCACYSVGEKTLCRGIKDFNLASVAEIGAKLKAGTNCGSCVPELKALLTKMGK